MRILLLIQKPQYRGAEIFTCQLGNHLKKIGLKVLIVSVYQGNAELKWNEKIIDLGANPNYRYIDFKAWRNLNHIIKNFKPDIVQANAGDTLKYSVFSKKTFGWYTPIIFRNASEVGRYLKSGLQKEFNKYLYKNVAGVASVSKASENDLLEYFPFLDGKTQVIPVGLEKNENIASIVLEPEDYSHIIHVGGFSFEKNHWGLIDIFEKVREKKKNVQLHLIGDGPLRGQIEELVKERGLEKYVCFYGFVNNPLAYIQAGDILILPSIIEGLPGVILEAMYCKTPVVAYDVGGISEILNKLSGNLIEKGNQDNFAKAIFNNLISPDTRKTEYAYQMVTKEYMNKTIAEKFMKFYQNIIL